MNYKILRELVIILKQKFNCPTCNKNVTNKELFAEAVKNNAVLLRYDCGKCGAQTIIEIVVVHEHRYNQRRQHRGLRFMTKTVQSISQNEVLDMKNFLKTFHGDFKSYFNQR